MASAARARMDYAEILPQNESKSSAVSWGSVFAGAFVTASLSLILLALGTGIGLSVISPWSDAGFSSAAARNAAIVWLILIEIIASAMGGYLAGRLRTKWVSVHVHEVYFRDTAHGFLVWSVGLVVTAVFFTSVAASMAGRTARGAANASTTGGVPTANGYFIDSLFRTDRPPAERADAATRAEAGIILANALTLEDIPDRDKAYLAGLVANTTGLEETAAEARVSETVTAERQAADVARKAVAHLMYWLFLALLVGAFCASFAATVGGSQRDRVPV